MAWWDHTPAVTGKGTVGVGSGASSSLVFFFNTSHVIEWATEVGPIAVRVRCRHVTEKPGFVTVKLVVTHLVLVGWVDRAFLGNFDYVVSRLLDAMVRDHYFGRGEGVSSDFGQGTGA